MSGICASGKARLETLILKFKMLIGISLNTKLNFKDAGLDTNWTLRTPAWTIRRKFSKEAAISSEYQFLRLWDLGLVSVLLALGLGYADVASGSFGNATQLIICKRKSTAVVEDERPIEVKKPLNIR
ncbi:hypothetical protein RhiirC2_788320 [Rhizophagus irregularis]|uniref:Uncharacterized protein n=1 Tax=Rhizophagus irregularis TaxID=588596 RepID=A0A2N1MQE0_9GLOM|nr:hypothetical protein RhiirC2_788320 [Rhizophagus irregularis]